MSALFLFAGIGVINGFLVSLYLFFKKNRSLAEVYFAGLLFALCVRIGKSILFHFDRQTDPFILQIGLSFCLFIGPFFYGYLSARFKALNTPSRVQKAGLFIFALGIILVGVWHPYRHYAEVWNGLIIYLIYGTWIVFTLLGLYELASNWDKVGKTNSQERRYLITLVVAYLFITITYQSALFLGLFYIWGSLIFTISFYYLMFRVITNQLEVVPGKSAPVPLGEGAQWMDRLIVLMEKEKPYLSPDLKLEELAERMQLSRHQLSRLLNERYPHGFSHFIREYRVAESKRLIAKHPEWSMEGIGAEAGFSSRSSFFEAFKKLESITPAQYKKTLIMETSPE